MSAFAAIGQNDINMLIQYINSGRSLNVTTNDGDIPLHLACILSNTKIEIIELLIKESKKGNGVNINFQNEYGETPLHLACLNNRLTTIQLLLDNGADINIKDIDGKSPFDFGSHDKEAQKIYDDYLLLDIKEPSN